MKFADEVEIDESYVPAGHKGTEKDFKESRDRGLKLRGRLNYEKDETPIVGVVQRGGKAVLRVADDLCNKFIRTLLKNHAEKGSNLYHDDYTIYSSLLNYDDTKLNHSEGGTSREKPTRTQSKEYSHYSNPG